MMAWLPYTNLRDYISQHPPVVTFVLCLLTLAVSFISISSYCYNHTLPNPDTSRDWNHLLSTLSQFHLCGKAVLSSAEPIPQTPPTPKTEADTLVNSTKSPPVVMHLKVPLTVTSNSDSGSLKDVTLYTTLRASQLQLGGNDIVSVSLDILSENETFTCLTINAQKKLLPMSLLPPKCSKSQRSLSPIEVEATNQLPTESQFCYSLHSRNDPALTIMLTEEEQWMAVQHLLEVSVCLLGVCFIICLAASLTH